MASKKVEEVEEIVTIKAPNIRTIVVSIEGTAPLVVNRFGSKAREQMERMQTATKGTSRKAREPKDFEACFQDARNISNEGWDGINAAAFRNACISACRVAGFAMTKAKLSIFVEPDGFGKEDGAPLVRIISKKPEMAKHAVRNESGVCDIRPRPMYREWAAEVKIRYDADQFKAQDVFNLMSRVGMQVGICEGRYDSKKSPGMGWGLFKIKS